MSLILKRFLACCLSGLLVSCSVTRYTHPASAQELADLVLIVSELPDGQVTHSWQRAEDFDLSRYKVPSGEEELPGRIVTAVAHPRDCDQENRECFRECMSRPLPRGFGHMTSKRKRGGKAEYCQERCWQAYRDCVELEKLRPQEFTAVDDALDWVKRNREVLLVGSVVMIAGVVFIVASAGAGVVVLVPVALMVASETPSARQFAGVVP
jgi:hypothetical protein